MFDRGVDNTVMNLLREFLVGLFLKIIDNLLSFFGVQLDDRVLDAVRLLFIFRLADINGMVVAHHKEDIHPDMGRFQIAGFLLSRHDEVVADQAIESLVFQRLLILVEIQLQNS